MNVFLSHINEEAQVASVLARWIESSFDRDVRISGEAEDVQLGEQRRGEVDRALGEAQVALVLCSGRSIGRPWISFESGCAWLKGVPVVAVCHSGCSTADLLPPLGNFQAFDLSDPASCQALLETLATHLQRKRIPRVDCNLMAAELKAATSQVRVPESNDVPAPAAARPAPAAPPQPLDLRLLFTIHRLPDYTCTATGLAEGLGESERKIRDVLDKLVVDHLLIQRASTNPTDPDSRYAITDKARSHLARLGR